ncbi:hypothetical protein ABZ926_32810 [Streptomyces litmocidini]|uniref:Uncharacterized protein n=1 Tax=Streptomyces litmocidini TaxID=67318 RepID=A0ABW7U850_9ACTN|nr:hypothetical protein [Streptomyces sp. PanSC19]ROQ34983.1 hypothetical protein EDD98_4037 [Streptomyces sp. PanSC19]
MSAPVTEAASLARDPELLRLMEQYVARRRRERLRRALEQSLAQRLLGEERPGPAAGRPPLGQVPEPGGTR